MACSVADEVVIVSPYITSNTAEIVTSKVTPGKCDIYTLFKAELFINLSSSIKTLIRLKKRGCRIYSVPKLHAKIIITSNDFATVGSQL